MTSETQPLDRSDAPPLYPKELLRQTVVNLANLEGGDDADVVKMGIIDLGPGELLVARIKDPKYLFPRDVLELLPSFLFKLTVYHSTPRITKDGAEVYVESVTIKDSGGDTVIGDVGLEEFDNMSPEEEDGFIIDFFINNHMGDLLED